MEKSMQIVVFKIDDQSFGLSLESVEEVIHIVETSPIPQMSKYIHGIINFRGEIIPVVNIRVLFGIDDKEPELSDQLIITKTKSRKLAILVDSTQDVFNLNESDIIESDQILYNMKYIKGVVKLENEMVLINDIEEFLTPENIKLLEDVIENEEEFLKQENN